MIKTKNHLLSLLCLLCLGFLFTTPIQASAHSIPVMVHLTGSKSKVVYATETTNYYVVNTNILNVRMTPNTKYAPIKKLSRGAKVKVIRTSGSWVEIETIHKHNTHYETKGFYAETGQMWVHKDYLKKGTSVIHLIPYRAYNFTCLER